MKIVLCLNAAWNVWNFRAGLIKALIDHGHEVVVVAPSDEYASRLPSLGCRYLPVEMDNLGTHPWRDTVLLLSLVKILMRERPDVYLAYTVKPNVYGSLAAGIVGVPVINNVAGLGSVFIRGGWLLHVVKALYRLAFRRSTKVFFQNRDDRQLFLQARLVSPTVTALLPGSGIDLARFIHMPLPALTGTERPFHFLLIARMLWDKGVGEFVEAARLITSRWPHARCQLLGFVDAKNPTAISRQQMDRWVAEGCIQYLGVSDDVRKEIALADCVVLPSYREGTPRTLLEAAAMGRPLITTDVPGCKEVVEDGRTGYLCAAQDAKDLAAKMERMLCQSEAQRAEMGALGRLKMEREFDEKIVIGQYLDAITSATSRKRPSAMQD